MKRFLKTIVWGTLAIIVVVVLISIFGGNTPAPVVTTQATTAQPPQSQAAPPPQAQFTIPAPEQTFVNIVGTAAASYATATNDMTKGALRHKRATDICAAFPTGKIDRWAATIQTLDSTDKGNGILVVSLNPTITLGTNNNEISDSLGTPTLIPVNSALFNKVSQMKVGDNVYFSGNFLSSDTDCFQESSLTTDGSMQSPDFLIQFSDVNEATGP